MNPSFALHQSAYSQTTASGAGHELPLGNSKWFMAEREGFGYFGLV
jgi:hypothetical protein